ncbi:glycosyltransferase [Salinarimonas soli]|uniref:Glycosyltransferase n=1 Tax=Salinarimonas soli TaxID=1638099 RepID=A0A5B2V5H4_9HYPH|nr:glycosyltransferase [Salinarimonas soli]KAA2234773.1 glycosyltransferase [Salinarimonas soli]
MLNQNPSLTVYFPDLSGGGAERLHLGLAPFFVAAGLKVTFLLDRRNGELLDRVPEGVEVKVLGASRQLKALPLLVRELRTAPPQIFLANMEHMNIMALIARKLSGARTQIVISQHISLSGLVQHPPSWNFRTLPFLYRMFAPTADAIVAVSRGVADDLASIAKLEHSRIEIIYNGAIADNFNDRAASHVSHPWLDNGLPLLLTVGRLVPQKDHAVLLAAFAKLLQERDARLLILGEGRSRIQLEAQARALNITDKIDMPGFVDDPLPFIKRANVVILASRFEGFGLVLAEALACGTPVVSTDCPFGPAEILDNGRFGPLVPVGDSARMARAIANVLDEPHDPAFLAARGREFTLAACAEGYLALFDRLLNGQRR